MEESPRVTAVLRYYDSPCGKLALACAGGRICLCDWVGGKRAGRNAERVRRLLRADFSEGDDGLLRAAARELDEYFAGARRVFGLPLSLAGTAFQKSVWRALREIPFGATCSYRDIAVRVGCPAGVRAVAQAVGSNPVSVIVPCHRVIGADGRLTGFGGGLEAKRLLLSLEGADFRLGGGAGRAHSLP